MWSRGGGSGVDTRACGGFRPLPPVSGGPPHRKTVACGMAKITIFRLGVKRQTKRIRSPEVSKVSKLKRKKERKQPPTSPFGGEDMLSRMCNTNLPRAARSLHSTHLCNADEYAFGEGSSCPAWRFGCVAGWRPHVVRRRPMQRGHRFKRQNTGMDPAPAVALRTPAPWLGQIKMTKTKFFEKIHKLTVNCAP